MANFGYGLLFVLCSLLAFIAVSLKPVYGLTNMLFSRIPGLSESTIISGTPTPFGTLLHCFVLFLLMVWFAFAFLGCSKEGYKHKTKDNTEKINRF